jgi:hypothetical protein
MNKRHTPRLSPRNLGFDKVAPVGLNFRFNRKVPR